jgi:hypothetical protein
MKWYSEVVTFTLALIIVLLVLSRPLAANGYTYLDIIARIITW